MATLTYQQIVQVARAGGLPGDPEVWAAIAMAESSGRTDVVNSIGCVGLWQINQPVHVRSHPTWTVSWLSNPVNNAKAAAVIYRGQGLAAWEAYTGPDGKGADGPWRQYYKGSKETVTAAGWNWNDIIGGWDDFKKGFNNPFGLGDKFNEFGIPTPNFDDSLGDPTAGLDGVATGIGTVAEGVQKAAAWLGNARNWVRVGYVVGGGVLVVLGLAIVARPLMNVAPTGQIVKAAKKAGAAAKKTTKGGGGE